jgi:2-polyprenyl-6-methoxyphenol hydroxylase-like FAD-dependent oxidoreductase
MSPLIAIIGAGMGGLTLAAALHQRGFAVRIFEQAPRFTRLGAGIQMSPNAMRVLRGIGLEPLIRERAFQPRSWTNREWDTGVLTNELPLGEQAEAKYGTPYLLMHRGDLHEALVSAVPRDRIALDKKLVDLDWRGAGVTLRFANGDSAQADAVIAADGIHSRVRELWLGPEQTNYTGRVAYRTTFPAALLQGFPIDHCCKWWGPDRHIVIYFVTETAAVGVALAAIEDVHGLEVVGENTGQFRCWHAAKAAIGADAEIRPVFACRGDALREARHIVDGAEIDPRALRLQVPQRREKGVVAAIQHRDVDPIDPAAGRFHESVGEPNRLAKVVRPEARPAAQRPEAEVVAKRHLGGDVWGQVANFSEVALDCALAQSHWIASSAAGIFSTMVAISARTAAS